MIQTELHRHLDVSLRLETLLRLAQARGLEGQSTSLDKFREKIVLTKPMTDLKTVLARFEIFQRVLDRPEVLDQVAYEAVWDCRREGTSRVEFRFSPTFVCEFNSMSWLDALEGFSRGIARARSELPEMSVGLLCIATRDFGVDAVSETVEFFLKNRSRFVGLDLAGNEAGFPNRLFESAFKPARDMAALITVHAGEGAGPENVWEAIEYLGARRIGHGITSEKDPKLIEYLARERICLEMCPTSNWITHAVESLSTHPLPRLLRRGVPVCINTDDPAVFGCTLSGEIEICRNHLGMSGLEVAQCFEHARAASFQ